MSVHNEACIFFYDLNIPIALCQQNFWKVPNGSLYTQRGSSERKIAENASRKGFSGWGGARTHGAWPLPAPEPLRMLRRTHLPRVHTIDYHNTIVNWKKFWRTLWNDRMCVFSDSEATLEDSAASLRINPRSVAQCFAIILFISLSGCCLFWLRAQHPSCEYLYSVFTLLLQDLFKLQNGTVSLIVVYCGQTILENEFA